MEKSVLRLEELLFPRVADVAVLSVDVNNEAICVEARRATPGSVCPGCRTWSSRVHSSYLRFPADVPSARQRVLLCLKVRRFFCSDGTFRVMESYHATKQNEFSKEPEILCRLSATSALRRAFVPVRPPRCAGPAVHRLGRP